RVQRLLQGSGLSAEQVRSRLQAQGYPGGMLDGYMSGGRQPAGVPNENVFAALATLGISTTGAVDSLQSAARLQQRTITQLDSELFDSLRKVMAIDPNARLALRTLLAAGEPATRAEADRGTAIFGLDAFRRA